MIAINERAANLLEGKMLLNGWKVIKKLKNFEIESYASYYLVERPNQKGFLKAFDYSRASKHGCNSSDEILEMLKAFKFEKAILEKCSVKKHKNLISLIECGELKVAEAKEYPDVNYIILEYSNKGHIDNKLIEESNFSLEWKILSLRHIANGLRNLHSISVAHQDIKPENLVLLSKEETKITDFGSAIDLELPLESVPKLFERDYAGTWEWAPPELLYGDVSSDPIIRRLGCDLYLLGSMISYYLTGYNMTSYLRANLDPSLLWINLENRGKYKELLSYIIHANNDAINDIVSRYKDEKIRETLRELLMILCNPKPEERGKSRILKGTINQRFNLEYVVSKLDFLRRYMKVKNFK